MFCPGKYPGPGGPPSKGLACVLLAMYFSFFASIYGVTKMENPTKENHGNVDRSVLCNLG